MKIWRISNQYMYIELYRHRRFYFKILYTTYLFFFVCDGLYKWEVNSWESDFFFFWVKKSISLTKLIFWPMTYMIPHLKFWIALCLFLFLLLASLKSSNEANHIIFYEGTNQHFFSLFFFNPFFLDEFIVLVFI